jgi:hypothetical protein
VPQLIFRTGLALIRHLIELLQRMVIANYCPGFAIVLLPHYWRASASCSAEFMQVVLSGFIHIQKMEIDATFSLLLQVKMSSGSFTNCGGFKQEISVSSGSHHKYSERNNACSKRDATH